MSIVVELPNLQADDGGAHGERRSFRGSRVARPLPVPVSWHGASAQVVPLQGAATVPMKRKGASDVASPIHHRKGESRANWGAPACSLGAPADPALF